MYILQLEISGTNIVEEVKDFLSAFLLEDDVEIEDIEYGNRIYPVYTPMQIPIMHGFSTTRPWFGHCQKYFEIDIENLSLYSKCKRDRVVYKFHIENGLNSLLLSSLALC